MKAYLAIAAGALCAMLLGIPLTQAEQQAGAKTVRIEFDFSEAYFSAVPDHVVLKVGEHYRLQLVNWSEGVRHVLISPELGRAVFTAGIRRVPEFERVAGMSFAGGIEVRPGERLEVYIVPYKEGRYKIFCQDRAHTNAGLDVAVEITL